MKLAEDNREGMYIYWIVSFFGGETFKVIAETAEEACERSKEEFAKSNNYYEEIYSVIAYPFYI